MPVLLNENLFPFENFILNPNFGFIKNACIEHLLGLKSIDRSECIPIARYIFLHTRLNLQKLCFFFFLTYDIINNIQSDTLFTRRP